MAETWGGRQRLGVVVNPTKHGAGALRTLASAESVQAGWAEPLWLQTTRRDPGQDATRRALEAGCTTVVAAGGDGTVRAVAEGLRDADARFVVVPLGTGNLYARNLDLPLSDAGACLRAAFDGEERTVDLGLVTATDADGVETEHCFLVIAGLGLDAAMIAKTRSWLKERVGWLAYIDGGVRSLTADRGFRIRYRLDEGPPRRAHVSTILVGNCGHLPGGLVLLPDAALDDGLLDIAVVQPRTVWGWLLLWRKVAWENRVLRRTRIGRDLIRLTRSDRTRVLSMLRGRTVRVDTAEPQPFELDGDEFGTVVALTFRLDEGGLTLRVPR